MGENELREPPDRGALERYANVVRRLEAVTSERGRSFDMDGLFALAEYDEAREMAYALGLVGGGLSADGLDAIDRRPLSAWALCPAARYARLHALWRCERHTHPPGSLVQAVIASGALSKAGRPPQFRVQLE